MHKLEEDDKNSSSVQEREPVGIAETQRQSSNVLKAHRIRLLRDGEDQTRPDFPGSEGTTLLLSPPTNTTSQETDEKVLSPAILKQRKRKRLIIAAIVLLAILVIAGVLTAGWFRGNAANGGTIFTGNRNTKPVVSGPRMVQLAFDKSALTSLFAAQTGVKQGVLSDLNAAPGPNDGLMLSFNMHIDANGIQRIIPVEIGGKVGLDGQHHLQLIVQQLKRDGVLADANTTANMQNAVNQMLASTVTTALQTQFKETKLISVRTSKNIICAKTIDMIVLQVEIPAVAGIAAQPTPVPFCFKGPIDLKKLLPQ